MSDETKDRQARLDALRQKAVDGIDDFDPADEFADFDAVRERAAIHTTIVNMRQVGRMPEEIARVLWAEFASPHKYEFSEVVERVRAEVRQIDLSKPKSRWDRFREWFQDWWAEAL